MLLYKNQTSGPPWYAYQFYQNTSNKAFFEWTNNSGTDYAVSTSSTLSAGTWYYVTFTRKSNVGQMYLNGSANGSSSTDTGTLYQSTGELDYGSAVGSQYIKGLLDEIRISNVARSADWISTEYNNQNSPDKATYGASGFYTVGSQTGR